MVFIFKDCCEMLMEKATCEIPQEDMPTLFPYACPPTNDSSPAGDVDQPSNVSSMDNINEIKESYEGNNYS